MHLKVLVSYYQAKERIVLVSVEAHLVALFFQFLHNEVIANSVSLIHPHVDQLIYVVHNAAE